MPIATAAGKPGAVTPPCPAPPTARRSTGFLLVYALAYAGGVIGYLPLLSLLLPIKVEAIAGEARLGLLTATVIAGAIAASASNILFGWLSDRAVERGKGRRRWLAGGVAATALSYAAVAAAVSPFALIVSIVAFQAAVNALLAPLLAIMADEIPDAQKGVASGLLAFANPAASALSAVMLGVALLGEGGRLVVVAAAMAAGVLPLLLSRIAPIEEETRSLDERRMLRRDLVIIWGARLLVQVAGNVLSLYLFYYFESVSPDSARADLGPFVGHVLTIAFVAPLPIAVLAGRLSDRSGRRKPFLLAMAVLATLGLIGMAMAENRLTGAVAFGVYATGSAVFLALHSGFAMQLLPSPKHRGRDLGLLNLANTLPALAGPLLTWLLATPRDFHLVMLALAGLTLGGGLAILGAQGRR